MNKKVILFDLDGTLLYTLGDLAWCTNTVLAAHGYPTHPEESFRIFVGDGACNQITRALPKGTNPATIDVLLNEYLELYAQHSIERTHPYDGIVELLAALKAQGYTLAVASNKPHARTVEVIEHYFPNTFDCVRGHLDGTPVKPDPGIVFDVLTAVGAERRDCFYVGDTATDVHTAKNAGVHCAGVLWGFRDAKELTGAGADVLCKDPDALKTAIETYFNK